MPCKIKTDECVNVCATERVPMGELYSLFQFNTFVDFAVKS